MAEHLGATLLQQTPPMSALLVGVFAKLVSWPHGLAKVLRCTLEAGARKRHR